MPITFRVVLDTVNKNTSFQPYTSSEASNFDATRSSWFPNNILANRKLEDGDEFEVSGKAAIYLRDTYTSGTYKILEEVSGSP